MAQGNIISAEHACRQYGHEETHTFAASETALVARSGRTGGCDARNRVWYSDGASPLLEVEAPFIRSLLLRLSKLVLGLAFLLLDCAGTPSDALGFDSSRVLAAEGFFFVTELPASTADEVFFCAVLQNFQVATVASKTNKAMTNICLNSLFFVGNFNS